MDLVFALIVPTVVLQTLAGRKPLLTISSTAGVFVGLGAVAQTLAATTTGHDWWLVRAAFVFGTLGLATTFWSSGSRLAFFTATAGAMMNLVPILTFGAMPVARHQVERFAPGAGSESALTAPKHQITDFTDDPVWLLADVVPIEPLQAVISLGDIFLVAGFALLSLERGRVPARLMRVGRCGVSPTLLRFRGAVGPIG